MLSKITLAYKILDCDIQKQMLIIILYLRGERRRASGEAVCVHCSSLSVNKT